MWKCTIGNKENQDNDLICQCGFDRSIDYENFRTIVKLDISDFQNYQKMQDAVQNKIQLEREEQKNLAEKEQSEEENQFVEKEQSEEKKSVEQDVSEMPLSISKIALPSILFWISWMVIPIMVYITGSEYVLEKTATVVVMYVTGAIAIGTLMYMGAVLKKKEALIMYGGCLGAALLCSVVSVSMNSDFGFLAFIDVFVFIIAAVLSFIIHFACKDKGKRVVIGGVGAVILSVAQHLILWFV